MSMASAPKQDNNSGSGLMSSSASSLCSLNEEVEIKKNQRKLEVFYELLADGTLKFSDGKTLKINVALLIVESEVFQQLFLSSSPEYIVNIEDFDLTTFKLFLDCLLGFQKFSTEDALIILPVTLKYETEQLKEKCLEMLKPNDLNENVCLSLNTGLVYKCERLSDSVLDFLKRKNRIYQLLDEELYRDHLEPESVLKLLESCKLDSYTLMNIITWGNRYLEKGNKLISLKQFFTEEKIINFISLDCFETAGSFLQLSKSEIGKEFFTDSDFLKYVETYGYDDRPINWIKIQKGDTLMENFTIKNVFFGNGYTSILRVYTGPVIYFNTPDDDEEVVATYDVVGKLLDCGNKIPQEPVNISWSSSLDANSPQSKVGRTKSLKVKSKETGSMEDLSASPEERQNKIKAKLKKFFNRRPTVDSLKKKGIYKDEPVFGCSLEQTTKNRKPRVPLFVQECVKYIEGKEENMKTDGLYRASGNLSQVQKIRLEVDQNNLSIMKDEEDVHVLTGSLKLFFRELKEPLIPFKQLETALRATDKPSRKDRIKDFQKLVKSLPEPNYDTLKFLLQHLIKVKEYQEFNRMNISNLAIVFGPTLMWPEQESANMALELMQQNVVIECLLKEFHEIFIH